MPIRRLAKRFSARDKEINFQIRKFDDIQQQVFFGYYDITPISHDDNLLLAMHAPLKNISPSVDTEIMIGFYNLMYDNPSFFEVGRTTTWCWQQGCRLQWYPVMSNQTVIYNRLVEGRYGCVIQDIHTGEIIREYKRPFYSVSRDGRWGISLNFSRLQRLRPGYGYVNFPDETEGHSIPENDGIWRIDMATGREDFLFSISEITRFEPLESMSGAEHYFNHILFNPNGTRFMFIHLWVKEGKRFSRMITCDISGEERYILNNEGHASHYTWKSNDELLVFSTHADTGTNFHLYTDRSSKRATFGKGVLTQDGHPSFSPDGSLLLLDSYPDRVREQHLFIYRDDLRKSEYIGSYYCHPKFKGEIRCDLHPRWSLSGKYICFDSVHEGKRKMYLIDMGSLV